MTIFLVPIPAEAKLTEAEKGLLAWAKLNYAEHVWTDLERVLNKKQASFTTISLVDEHRIRLEATGRGVRLTRSNPLPETSQPDAR